MDSKAIGILLSDDLMFTSRITGTASDLGFTVRTARASANVEAISKQQRPACVILDLENSGLSVSDLLAKLRETCSPMPFIVAYGSHVDTASLQAARDAGCDIVWPRSKFVQELAQAMPGWFTKETKNDE